MNRRHLLSTIALLPVAIGLAACPQIAKVASDAEVIANGVSAILPTITQIIGIKDATVAKITSIVTGIKTAAAALESATGTAVQTLAQQVAAGTGALQSAVAGFSLPPWVSQVVQDAVTLAPIVLQVAGVALAGPSPDQSSVTAARARLVAVVGK